MSIKLLIEEARRTQPRRTEAEAYEQMFKAREMSNRADRSVFKADGGFMINNVVEEQCDDPDINAIIPNSQNQQKVVQILSDIESLPIDQLIKNQISYLLIKSKLIHHNDCDDALNEYSVKDLYCSEVSLYHVDGSNPYENIHGCWELYFREWFEYEGEIDSFIGEPTHLPLLPSYVFDKQSLKILFR